MSVINTNILALTSQNNLTKSQGALGQAIERLSSGLRINSAKDDAAGQAIANRFTANINGLTQAARNANDGISVAQTTEGALNEINENLQRIRTLTVQASTGSNSDSDLQSIQAEINQRLDEINRVSEQTQFNGVKVLADNQALVVQVGANDNEQISINLQKIDKTSLGLSKLNVARPIDTGKVGAPATKVEGKTPVDTSKITLTSTTPGAGSVDGIYYESSSKTYYAKVSSTDSSDVTGYYKLAAPAADGALTTETISIVAGKTPDILVGNESSTLTQVTSIKGQVDPTGNDKDNLVVYNGSNANDPKYVIKAQDSAGEDIYFEAHVAADGAVTRGASLSTEAQTVDPLKAIDNALSKVDSLRSDLGAVQNRFQSTITNLSNTITNLSAARSRIEDADYAVEVSNMTRAQILQQAGTSVLAQANQVPQTVLSLLR